MTAGRVGRRGAGAVLVAISLAQTAAVIDYYALTVALPDMARDFGVTATDLHWVLTAYLITLASLMVLGGRLADGYGRRRVLIAGIATFGLASALCGLAPGVVPLVAFRVLQGAGAALLLPASTAALVAAFPEERRGWAIGVVLGVSSAGTAIGPFVGGALTGALDWRWVFFVNVPVTLAAIVMCVIALDESREEGPRRRLDVGGAALLAAALVALLLTVDRLQAWPIAGLAATAAGAAAFLVAFVVHEGRTGAPLVDLGLLRRGGIRAVLVAGCLANYGWAAAVFAVTVALQVVRDLSPIRAGMTFLALSAGSLVGSPLAGRILRRHSPAAAMTLALVFSIGGFVWLAAVVDTTGPLIGALALTGLGVGLAYSIAITATAAAAAEGQAGSAEGVTMTAMIVVAAVAVTSAGLMIEAFSTPGRPTSDAIAGVLLVAAGVALVALLALAGRGAALRGWRARGSPG